MVVRDRVGRKRYIVVLFPAEVSRREANRLLSERLSIPFRLTYHAGRGGIVLVKHTDKERAIEEMNAGGLRTVKTSGTIRKAKEILARVLSG